MVGVLVISMVVVLTGCGTVEPSEQTTDPARSVASGRGDVGHQIFTEADAGKDLSVPYFYHDIGLPNQKGTEIHLSGDDASTLRWRFVHKPDPLYLEWANVNGKGAFETDGLIGDPTIAAKVLEFRGLVDGETTVIVELVERDSADRYGDPVKRLEYNLTVAVPRECCRIQY